MAAKPKSSKTSSGTVKKKTTKKKVPSLDPEPKVEKPQKHRAVKPRKAARTMGKGATQTKLARDTRKGTRKPPPVPKNKTHSEIAQMDPDDPRFKHPGRPRKKSTTKKKGEVTFNEAISHDRQNRANGRRSKVRKWEAEVVSATQEYSVRALNSAEKGMELNMEDKLIQEQVLSLDSWDNAELARGYRRNRNGKFGPPPKYIPRQVQAEAFKRLVGRGNAKLKRAYLRVILELIQLTRDPNVPPKVRLEAQKEVLDRLVGKTPDHLRIQQDAPWQDFLVDAVEPVSLVERTETQVKRLRFEGDLGDGGEAERGAAAGLDRPSALPPPSPDIEDAVVVDPDFVDENYM